MAITNARGYRTFTDTTGLSSINHSGRVSTFRRASAETAGLGLQFGDMNLTVRVGTGNDFVLP